MKTFKEVTDSGIIDQLLNSVEDFFDGFEGSDASPTIDDFKEYATAIGIVPVGFIWSPEMDQVITEEFTAKINSQESLPGDEEDEDEEEEYIIQPDELTSGDILDMGPYGTNIIFIHDQDGERFWGTDDADEYLELGDEASGWYFHYGDIEDLMGNVHDDDDELDDHEEGEFYDSYDDLEEASIFGQAPTSIGSNPPGPETTRANKELATKALNELPQEVDLTKISDEELDQLLQSYIVKQGTPQGI